MAGKALNVKGMGYHQAVYRYKIVGEYLLIIETKRSFYLVKLACFRLANDE